MNKNQFQWFVNFPTFILFEVIIILIWDYYIPMRILISLMIYVMYVLVVIANRCDFKEKQVHVRPRIRRREKK